MKAVARRSGRPSNPVRALALVLAALASAIPLLLLLYGLSMRTIEAMRQMPILVQLIPEPQPVPEPPPPPAPSAPRVRPERAAPAPVPAPAAAPQPASPVERMPDPAASPAPVSAPVSGAGAGVVSGTANGDGGGSGSGGSGAGGSGTGGGALLAPSWVFVPGYRELAPHNPGIARNEKINGTVLLACHGTAAKRVTGCRVLSESPPGYGFGGAAIAAAKSFRINPPRRDGRIDEAAWIGIPVSFNNRR